ncbi:unnamed protein product, partial [Ixodes pacificus]
AGPRQGPFSSQCAEATSPGRRGRGAGPSKSPTGDRSADGTRALRWCLDGTEGCLATSWDCRGTLKHLKMLGKLSESRLSGGNDQRGRRSDRQPSGKVRVW